jgi:hypothetical protein
MFCRIAIVHFNQRSVFAASCWLIQRLAIAKAGLGLLFFFAKRTAKTAYSLSERGWSGSSAAR